MIAEGLFPNENPVGQFIKIKGLPLTVIGVFKRQGESLLGNTTDTEVLIPLNYMRNLIDVRNERFDPFIMVKAKAGITNDELIDELRGIMRSVRKVKPTEVDDFALNQTSLISKGFDGLFDVVGTAGWLIGGFSILVGGFGIANIMFVSVKERTSLIGIQKALGAKNYFILLQFLVESVVLCLIGGIIGLLMIYGVTIGVSKAFDMEVELFNSNIILGLTISILIGIISGFIPAYSASQLDPVEAIRA
jgi:putative ABC transport system permease protein